MKRKWLIAKTAVHGNGTKWLLLGECSCFFSLFLPRAESHISSRLGMRGRRQGRKRLAFYANDEGCAVAARCTGDGAAKWQITRVYPQPSFLRGAHSTSEIKRRWALGSKTTPFPPRISRPSIHHINLRRQCLQHPSVTSRRQGSLSSKAQDHFAASAQKFMKHSQCLTPPPLFTDDRFLTEKIAVWIWFSLEKYLKKRIDDIFYICK